MIVDCEYLKMRRTANVAHLNSLSPEIAHRFWERSRQVSAEKPAVRRSSSVTGWTITPWCPTVARRTVLAVNFNDLSLQPFSMRLIIAASDFVLRAKTELVYGTCEWLPVVCSFSHAEPNVEETEVKLQTQVNRLRRQCGVASSVQSRQANKSTKISWGSANHFQGESYTFPRNYCKPLPDYTVSHLRRRKSS